MIIPRSIGDPDPPDRRTRVSNNPTLLYSWWCTLFSVVIIGTRLSGRYIRNERLFREDKIMAWSIIPLMTRMAFIHVVLIWGTNNVDTTGLVDPVKIHHRAIGSRLVLAARIFYAMFIWMAKFTISEFLKRLTERFWKKRYDWGLRAIRIFLVITFIMVVIATLAECQPFNHYWQVIPDPGPKCRQGYAQLLTMGIADITTDILLVAFPIPIILQSGMTLKRKGSLISLFSMSIILIGITAARMPLVIHRRGIQQFRTVFASSEILAAAIISNAIVLGSFMRDRGLKKQKFKAPSTTDSMERRGSARRMTNLTGNSDEDLARSLGYRTKPELEDKSTKLPRPAPAADLSLLGTSGQPGPFTNMNWQFPNGDNSNIQTTGHSNLKVDDIRDPLPSPRSQRRVSWFDVGGLMENGGSPTDSVITHDFATQPRRGSRASTSIITNGRIANPGRRSSRLSQQSSDHESPHQHQRRSSLQVGMSSLSQGREVSSPRPASAHQEQHAPVQRSNTNISYDTPSLQDAGGLLSPSLPASNAVQRSNTHTSEMSYDVPSLKDAGGLLSPLSPRSKPSSPSSPSS